MFPLVVHTMDLVVSAAGILSVGSKSSAKPNQAIEDPYDVIKVGVQLSCSSKNGGGRASDVDRPGDSAAAGMGTAFSDLLRTC